MTSHITTTKMNSRRARTAGLAFTVALSSSVASAADMTDPQVAVKAPKMPRVIEVPHTPEKTNGSMFVALRGSISLTSDVAFAFTAPDATVASVLTRHKQPAIGGSIAFGNNYNVGNSTARFEIETGRTHMTARQQDFTNVPMSVSGSGQTGNIITDYVMASASYDLLRFKRFSPFVKAGVGYAKVNFKELSITPTADTMGITSGDKTMLMDSSGSGLAWQVGLGSSVQLHDTLAMEIGYNYFNVENIDVTSSAGNKSSIDLDHHKLDFGLRLDF